MKSPLYNNVPCWYRLTFDITRMSFELKIHHLVMKYFQDLPWQFGSDGKSGYGADFQPPVETRFGYHGVLELVDFDDLWWRWEF